MSKEDEIFKIEEKDALVVQPCQSSTNFLNVAKGKGGIEGRLFSQKKWRQLFNILKKKFEKKNIKEPFSGLKDILSLENASISLRDKVLENSENYKNFVNFLIDQGVINFDPKNPRKISEEVVRGVEKLLDNLEHNFRHIQEELKIKPTDKGFVDDMKRYFENPDSENNLLIEKIVSIQNVTEMNWLLADDFICLNLEVLLEGKKEITDEVKVNFFKKLLTNENGQLFLAVLLDKTFLKKETLRNFFVDKLSNDYFRELGKNKNGQFLIKKLIENGYKTKTELRKIISKEESDNFHQDSQGVLKRNFWEKLFKK